MTSWLPAGTAANVWSVLDRAHSGFWDDTPIIEISATAGLTPVPFSLPTHFDVITQGAGFGSTATATMQTTSCFMDGGLLPATATVTTAITTALDGSLFGANRITEVINLNAILSAFTATQALTPSLDGILLETTTTLTLAPIFDSRLLGAIRFTVPGNFDALLSLTETSAVFLDATLFSAATAFKTINLDATLSASATRVPKLASLDAAIAKTFSKTSNYDSVLLQVFTNTLTSALDGALAKTITKTSNYDSILVPTTLMPVGLDGAISKRFSFTFNADATLLQINHNTRANNFDALLGKQVTQDIVAMDSVFLKTLALNSQINLNALLFRNVHPVVQLEAFLNLTFANTGADAVIVSGTSVGTTILNTGLDATLGAAPPTAGADAVIAQRFGFFFLS